MTFRRRVDSSSSTAVTSTICAVGLMFSSGVLIWRFDANPRAVRRRFGGAGECAAAGI